MPQSGRERLMARRAPGREGGQPDLRWARFPRFSRSQDPGPRRRSRIELACYIGPCAGILNANGLRIRPTRAAARAGCARRSRPLVRGALRGSGNVCRGEGLRSSGPVAKHNPPGPWQERRPVNRADRAAQLDVGAASARQTRNRLRVTTDADGSAGDAESLRWRRVDSPFARCAANASASTSR